MHAAISDDICTSMSTMGVMTVVVKSLLKLLNAFVAVVRVNCVEVLVVIAHIVVVGVHEEVGCVIVVLGVS